MNRRRLLITGGSSNPYPAGVNHTTSKTVVNNPFAMGWTADGLKVYVGAGNASVFEYVLTAAWDLTTGGSGSSVGAGQNTIRSLCFADSGNKIFISEAAANDSLIGFSTLNPYQWSGKTTDGNIDIEAQVGGAHTDVFIKPDGTKFYMLTATNDNIHQYSMSTPFDITTASYDSVTYATGIASPQSLCFTPDGLKLFIIDHTADLLRMYPLTTAWDLSTVGAQSGSFDYTGQESDARVIRFGENGQKMYILGVTGADEIHEYTLNPAYTI